jgi:hypothetical protein
VILASALTELDAWVQGVLFPVSVAFIVGCAGVSVRCLISILREFQETRRDVLEARRELRRISHALVRAGILDDDPDG